MGYASNHRGKQQSLSHSTQRGRYGSCTKDVPRRCAIREHRDVRTIEDDDLGAGDDCQPFRRYLKAFRSIRQRERRLANGRTTIDYHVAALVKQAHWEAEVLVSFDCSG